MKRRYLLIALFACCSQAALYSQTLELIGAAGDEASNSQSQLSYTVGELVVATGESGDNTVTQGYQQSNLFVTGIDEPIADFNLRVYPNPTSDILILESKDFSSISNVALYDLKGALIQNINSPSDSRISIDMSDVSAGNYMLVAKHVSSAKPFTYQVIKTH